MAPPPPDAAALAMRDEAIRSFLSGHAATTAALSFAAAGLWAESGRASPTLAYGLAVVPTAAVSTLRVVAGRHYPTDVLAGACIGGAVGAFVPRMHRMGKHGVAASATARDIAVEGRW